MHAWACYLERFSTRETYGQDNLIHRSMKMVLFHLTSLGSFQYRTGSQQGTFGQGLEWQLHHFGAIMTYGKREQ